MCFKCSALARNTPRKSKLQMDLHCQTIVDQHPLLLCEERCCKTSPEPFFDFKNNDLSTVCIIVFDVFLFSFLACLDRILSSLSSWIPCWACRASWQISSFDWSSMFESCLWCGSRCVNHVPKQTLSHYYMEKQALLYYYMGLHTIAVN